MSNKIEELISTVTRIETKMDDFHRTTGERCAKHSVQLAAHEMNLNGDGGREGINEKLRAFEKRHMFIAMVIPNFIIIVWEVLKHKLTGNW
jgi:hypothetical protein